jgi:hypothetical protein
MHFFLPHVAPRPAGADGREGAEGVGGGGGGGVYRRRTPGERPFARRASPSDPSGSGGSGSEAPASSKVSRFQDRFSVLPPIS